MKALTWHGKHDIRCESVPDPKIQDSGDVIIKVTACTCWATKPWDKWSRLDPASKTFRAAIALWCRSRSHAGNAFSAEGFYSACERSNPDRKKAEEMWRHSPAGLFGYSHILGGYPGGQAEYLRVPYADVGPIKIENDLSDEQVLFLSDIFPTGYMAADFCDIKGGETVSDLGLWAGRAVRCPQRPAPWRGQGHRRRYGARAPQACSRERG